MIGSLVSSCIVSRDLCQSLLRAFHSWCHRNFILGGSDPLWMCRHPLYPSQIPTTPMFRHCVFFLFACICDYFRCMWIGRRFFCLFCSGQCNFLFLCHTCCLYFWLCCCWFLFRYIW